MNSNKTAKYLDEYWWLLKRSESTKYRTNSQKTTKYYYRQKHKNCPKYRIIDTDKLEQLNTNNSIHSNNQYKQKLLSLINGFTCNKLPISILNIINYYFSPFHKITSCHYFIIYTAKRKRNYKHNSKKKHNWSYQFHFEQTGYQRIECHHINSEEYIPYIPIHSNGNEPHFVGEKSSYLRYDSIIYKIGTDCDIYYGNQNISFNIKDGIIQKLPILKPVRYHSGLCYSKQHGLICIGGKQRLPIEAGLVEDDEDIRRFKDVHQLINNKWKQLANLKDYMSDTKCLILNNENKMFLCGGMKGQRSQHYYEWSGYDLDEAQIYNFDQNCYVKLNNMNNTHYGHQCIQWTQYNGNIVVVDNEIAEYYNFHKNKWYSLPDLKLCMKTIKLSQINKYNNHSNVLMVIGYTERYHDDVDCGRNAVIEGKTKRDFYVARATLMQYAYHHNDFRKTFSQL
eukprot:369247_1